MKLLSPGATNASFASVSERNGFMLTGLFFGNLLPMNGTGIGPGGIDLQTLRSCRRMRIGKAMRPAHVYHESNIDTKDIVIDLWILSETIDTKEKSLRISRRFSIIVEAFKVSSPQAQVGTTGCFSCRRVA